jgi:hypothetical protein
VRFADGPASLSAPQRLRGGFGVCMFQRDLLDLEFLNFNLLHIVNPKPQC